MKTNKFFETLKTEPDYTFDGEYVNNKVKVDLRHTVCGTVFPIRPNDFQQGKRCPKCANLKRQGNLKIKTNTIKSVKEEIERDPSYRLVSTEYINNKLPLLIQHTECTRTFEMRYNDFQQGYRCPHCSLESRDSEAVKEIISYFENEGIVFSREKKFADCKRESTLAFDFELPLEDGRTLLIEYNGKQHYYVNENSAWIDNFKATQANDLVKQEYVKNREDLLLLVIKYDSGDVILDIEQFMSDNVLAVKKLL